MKLFCCYVSFLCFFYLLHFMLRSAYPYNVCHYDLNLFFVYFFVLCVKRLIFCIPIITRWRN